MTVLLLKNIYRRLDVCDRIERANGVTLADCDQSYTRYNDELTLLVLRVDVDGCAMSWKHPSRSHAHMNCLDDLNWKSDWNISHSNTIQLFGR